jgi:hypothetical protein
MENTNPEPVEASTPAEPVVETVKVEASDETPNMPSIDKLTELKTVLQTDLVYKTTEKNVKPPEDVPVEAFLPTDLQTTIKITDENPAADQGGTEENKRRWARQVERGMMLHTLASQFVSSVDREEAQWRQHIETPKGDLGIQSPRFAETGSKLTGDAAVIRMNALLGRGSLVSVPLIHSGFWITLRSPSDAAMVALRSTLVNEKIKLGRSTHGLVFSNTQSYSNSWLLDLALDHLYASTLKDVGLDEIREMIKTPDLPLVFWGLACVIWPNGFHYVRPDLTQEGLQQKDYHSGLIDIKKMLWIDNMSLTERQRSHMANRQPKSITKDMVDLYLQDFPLNNGRTITVGSEEAPIKINLTIPSADKYIRSGYRWINGLADMIERTFTGNRSDEDSRNVAIIEQANATIMRQYAHWIHSIEFDNQPQTDQETLDKLIDTLAQDPADRKKLMKAIGDFIDDITVGLIAIPEANGREVGPKRFTRLIPIDAVTTFFFLLMQRVDRILSE